MKGSATSWLRGVFAALLGLISIELVLGGGGRLIAWGPISARMVLYLAAMIVTAFAWLRGAHLPRIYNALIGIFAGMLLIGIVIGYSAGSNWHAILEDVKPLHYFFLLPFLYFSIDSVRRVEQLARWFQLGGLILALAFLALLIAIHTGAIPFLSFYHTVDPTGEFFFRGEITFFYKGFLYLCIAFIFLVGDTRHRIWLLPILLAIVLSATRGFWIALLLTYSGYWAILKRGGLRRLIWSACLLIAAVLFAFYSQQLISSVSQWLDRPAQENTVQKTEAPRPFLLGDREHSDNVRKRQLIEVADRTTLTSTFVGHGFGIGVPIRPVHMEISYLEIFHKQGLLGLLVWLTVFIVGFRKYLLASHAPWASAFFLSFLFVFIQSVFNQYINNPIGLFILTSTIVALDRLAESVPKNNQ